jgi:membrane protein YqaA with SNARE-associated domain
VDPTSLRELGTAALWAATFGFALVSGVVPWVLNIELYLIAVATLTDASPVAIVGLSTAGQTLAKYILYLVGRGSLNVSWIKRGTMSKAAEIFTKRPNSGLGIVAVSSVTGFPPLYGVALVAGALRLPVVPYMVAITLGRIVRFGACYLAPGFVKSLW